MTNKQLSTLVRREARRLRLDGWTFDASWGDAGGSSATISIEPEYQTATLVVAPPETLAEVGKDFAPLKETIIHELLHVRLEGHRTQTGKYDPAYELGLNIVAELLGKR